ncbi:progonadoliberin-1 isoform X2 [Crotalus tigris]|nr:progonadoliberin-1 isoform X2 [Crotalus tigris]
MRQRWRSEIFIRQGSTLSHTKEDLRGSTFIFDHQFRAPSWSPDCDKMQKTRMLISSFFLLLFSLSICFAQHWSYGFQPGGKRDVENLRDSFQEIENEVGKVGEMQPFECNVPRQHFTLRGLKSVRTGKSN